MYLSKLFATKLHFISWVLIFTVFVNLIPQQAFAQSRYDQINPSLNSQTLLSELPQELRSYQAVSTLTQKEKNKIQWKQVGFRSVHVVLSLVAVFAVLYYQTSLIDQYLALHKTNLLAFNLWTAAIATPLSELISVYVFAKKKKSFKERMIDAMIVVALIGVGLFNGWALTYGIEQVDKNSNLTNLFVLDIVLQTIALFLVATFIFIIISLYKKIEKHLLRPQTRVSFKSFMDIFIITSTPGLIKYIFANFVSIEYRFLILEAGHLFTNFVAVATYNNGRPFLDIYDRWLTWRYLKQPSLEKWHEELLEQEPEEKSTWLEKLLSVPPLFVWVLLTPFRFACRFFKDTRYTKFIERKDRKVFRQTFKPLFETLPLPDWKEKIRQKPYFLSKAFLASS